MKTGNGVLKSRYTYYVTVTVRQTQKLRFVAAVHCSVSHPVSQWTLVVDIPRRLGVREYGREETANKDKMIIIKLAITWFWC